MSGNGKHLDFFEGERLTQSFVLRLHRGKASLSCEVFEHWVSRIERSVSCGVERKHKVKRVLGVSVTETEELSEAVSVTLGLSLGQLKAEAGEKLGYELKLEDRHEAEEEFTIKAPECGRKTLLVYQFSALL